MEKRHAAGVSLNTLLKQQHVATFLSVHMKVVQSIIGRGYPAPDYLYFDLNGGPGIYEILPGQLLEGSPILAVRIAQALGLPLDAHVTESDPKTFESLRQVLHARGLGCAQATAEAWLYTDAETTQAQIRCWLYHRRHTVQIPRLLPRLPRHRLQYGLAYSDENGAQVPFGVLQQIARQYPKVDVLIHVSGTGIKRALPSQAKNARILSLAEGLAQIPKTHWQIRKTFGPQQWTLLFGTNWPEAFRLHKQGFRAVASPEGQSIFRLTTQTREAINDDDQPSLFGA